VAPREEADAYRAVSENHEELPGIARSDQQTARGNQGHTLWLNMKTSGTVLFTHGGSAAECVFCYCREGTRTTRSKNDGRGSTGIKDLVRREKAIPGVHVVQNGCAEMQASGIAVTGWRSDLTEGALGDIEHTKAKFSFVETWASMHLSPALRRMTSPGVAR
jgi:hypothetical protein